MWTWAGRASRSSSGITQPVATGSVSTVLDQSLAETPEHGLKGLALEAPTRIQVEPGSASRPSRSEAAALFPLRRAVL